MADKKEETEKILVVAQLPVQPYNETEVEGDKVRLVTIEDALTQILNKVSKIERSVA